MALAVGTNSWVTRAEADTYLADRIGTDLWDALTDANKDKYLVTAYYWIINYPGVTATASDTDQNLKNAQIEAALFLVSFYDDLNSRSGLYTSGVRRFTKSKWSETLEKQTLPPSVENPLSEGGFYNGGSAACITLTDTNTCY
jgi:hypothetical protein